MRQRHLIMAAAIMNATAVTTLASADVIEVGYVYNTGPGTIYYEGAFGDFVSTYHVQTEFSYTVMSVDVTALLQSIGRAGFTRIFVVDTGENVYTTTPGADIDLFRIDGLSSGIEYTFAYDGPVALHQSETPAQLAARVAELDWGTAGGGLSSGTFVSLGEFGELSAMLSQPQYIAAQGGGQTGPGGSGSNFEGPPQITLEISEVGNSESFRIFIDTIVPAPGAFAMLPAFLLSGRRRRRRA